MTVVAFVVLVAAVSALLCGHQGVTPPRPRRGAWRRAWAPRRAGRGSRVETAPPSPARGRTAPRPLWAQTQPLASEETA